MTYEVFDEERPSHLPSYIMSGFVLVGVISIAQHVPEWPPPPAVAFLLLWFGMFFRWMLLDAREKRVFRSHRLTVTDTAFRHSSRYAVAEVGDVEVPLSKILEVRTSATEPWMIEILGDSVWDVYFLPPSADVGRVIEAIRAGNPEVRITT